MPPIGSTASPVPQSIQKLHGRRQWQLEGVRHTDEGHEAKRAAEPGDRFVNDIGEDSMGADQDCRHLVDGVEDEDLAEAKTEVGEAVAAGKPTNHLDMATKEMLIGALRAYEGTMLFVSHDRHFLAALSNRVLELTPDGVHNYGGGYVEYVARTGHEASGVG